MPPPPNQPHFDEFVTKTDSTQQRGDENVSKDPQIEGNNLPMVNNGDHHGFLAEHRSPKESAKTTETAQTTGNLGVFPGAQGETGMTGVKNKQKVQAMDQQGKKLGSTTLVLLQVHPMIAWARPSWPKLIAAK